MSSGAILEIAGGSITTLTRGDINMHAENISFHAATNVVWKGEENGVFLGIDPKSPPPTVATEVLEIRINTPLDPGCDWRPGGANRDGLIYGKAYEFEAFRFKDGVVPAENDIRWSYRYDGENGIVEKEMQHVRGAKKMLTIQDPDILGRAVTIRAYVQDSAGGNALTLWAHYRFRWLSRHLLKTDLAQRVGGHPELIDQGQSSLCGIAVAGFFWCKDRPQQYEDYILKMHQRGSFQLRAGLDIEIDSDEHLTAYKMTDTRYPMESPPSAAESKQGKIRQRMSPVDFIFLVVLKDYLNNLFDYDPDGPNSGSGMEGTTGLTLPNEVAWVMREVAKYPTVEDETNLVTSKWSGASASAKEIADLLKGGNSLAILINANRIMDNTSGYFTIPTHWVGVLRVFDNPQAGTIYLEVFSWGGRESRVISYDNFVDGYFGYVRCI